MLVVVNGEIDEKIGIVINIVDGDTFDISIGDRIRLADIETPESDGEGYQEVKDYLTRWIYEKIVYLDVDNVFTYDYNGTGNRFACVAYVSYNSTHYLNTNKALLNAGHAIIDDYHNEFDPYSWSLFVLKPNRHNHPHYTAQLHRQSPSYPTPNPTPSPTLSPTPTPVSGPDPTPTPLPPIRFYNPYLILFGTTLLLIALGILAYYKKYRK